MKLILIMSLLILCHADHVWSLKYDTADESIQLRDVSLRKQKMVFRQSIPSIANQFISIPYRFGGNPRQSGTSDNSHLFFSIYVLAAKKVGLSYEGYLPMADLLPNTVEIDKDALQNGDLIVLENGLAAMVYMVEESGKLHFIYASKKRQKIFAFTSDNFVFQAYWLKNLKGFYRLSDSMLKPVNFKKKVRFFRELTVFQ